LVIFYDTITTIINSTFFRFNVNFFNFFTAECASRSFGEEEEEELDASQPPRTNPLVRYYPHIMPVLKQILHTCEKKEERLFRARALECATLFGK